MRTLADPGPPPPGPSPGDLDPVLHQPVRLRIMGALYRYRLVGFPTLRDGLALTPGNLATHLARLEEAGYLSSARALVGTQFQMRYAITPAGSAAFETYLASMRALLASLEDASATEVVGIRPRSAAARRALDEG